MKRKLLKSTVGLLAIASSVQAHAEVPTLRLPVMIMGARPGSLGGAFTAVADDQNALFSNPAGLARLDSTFAGLFDVSLSASLGSGGISSLMNDFENVVKAVDKIQSSSDTSKIIDNVTSVGELVSSRTAAVGIKNQSYWVSPKWGIASTLSLDVATGLHAKILPEVIDFGVLGDVDVRGGYAQSFQNKKISLGAAPYYRLRAQGGKANFSIAEAIEPQATIRKIVAIGHGVGLDLGLMVTPIEAMSPSFGLAILNLGDTKLYKTGSSIFSNASFLKDADIVGAPDLIKQIVNVGFSISPIDGPGFVRLSGELREINRPSAAELKPAVGVEGGFRSRYLRALADAGWGNGSWSAGFELRAFMKLRFSTYIEPNLFFDRKDSQRVWIVSLGI